jgi:hypothetical protein
VVIQGLTGDNLTLDPGASIVKFMGTFGQRGTTVSISQVTLTNSKLTDFIQVENVESVSVTGVRMDLLNNQVTIMTMADPMRNGLLQINNVRTVLIENFFALSSSLTLAPVILTDSVVSFTI